ncbi:MAG: hypothetical protein ACWA5P_06775 [bacterium]
MEEDHSSSTGTFSKPTKQLLKTLKYYNIDHKTLFGFQKRLKYTERIIEVGEIITVGGIAKLKSINDVELNNYNYSLIAVIESSVNQKILITDSPKASSLDLFSD